MAGFSKPPDNTNSQCQWSYFPIKRHRLADWIKKTKGNHQVLLTGDTLHQKHSETEKHSESL